MVTFTGPPDIAIRNKPISADLKQVLDTAARAAGVDTVRLIPVVRMLWVKEPAGPGPHGMTGGEQPTFSVSSTGRH